MMLHATATLLFGLILSAQGADAPKGPGKRPEGAPSEGKRKDGPPDGGEKKGPPPPPKEGAKADAKCGRDLGASLGELKKRKDVNREALEGVTRDHYKVFHPEGACHCECGHKPPAPAGEGEKRPERKCGRDAGALGEELRKRKEPGSGDVDPQVKDHFRIRHPDGVCHCFCRHEEGSKGEAPKDGGGKDARKGNNGVGNGVDPQPPGKPPVNDGPGSGPGNPGNKKGGTEGRK